MRKRTLPIRAESELNSDQKRQLSEFAEAFVLQSQKIARTSDGFQTIVSGGSSSWTPDSAPQMVFWENETNEFDVRRPESEQVGVEKRGY
jgi:hypothetical protein